MHQKGEVPGEKKKGGGGLPAGRRPPLSGDDAGTGGGVAGRPRAGGNRGDSRRPRYCLIADSTLVLGTEDTKENNLCRCDVASYPAAARSKLRSDPPQVREQR